MTGFGRIRAIAGTGVFSLRCHLQSPRERVCKRSIERHSHVVVKMHPDTDIVNGFLQRLGGRVISLAREIEPQRAI